MLFSELRKTNARGQLDNLLDPSNLWNMKIIAPERVRNPVFKSVDMSERDIAPLAMGAFNDRKI
jgi:hypothetical protein